MKTRNLFRALRSINRSINVSRVGFCPPVCSRSVMVLGVTMRTRFAPQPADAFFDDDGKHAKGSDRIGPPPPKQRVQNESREQDDGKIRTDIALMGVRVQCVALEFRSDASLCPCEQWHDDNTCYRVTDTEISRAWWQPPK